MKLLRHRLRPLLAPAVAVVFLAGARADEASTSIKFSDPSKPGTVKISLGRGELRVQGTDTNEVTVKSDSRAAPSKPRKDGLREISTASSFSLTEKDNVVTLDAASPEWGKGGLGDFKITVPRSASVIVQSNYGGDVACSGINGDLEINSMHGEIRLDDVAGGVVADTKHGEIKASVRELREGKPLSFTAMNGEVVVRVPATAKANVRLRTQNGSVLTDFDEGALVTKTEATSWAPRSSVKIKNKGGISGEIQDAIREATQVSATAVREALEAVKEGLEASRVDTEDAKRQLAEARAELERARRETERERRTSTTRSASRSAEASASPAAIPAPGAPPAPPLMTAKVSPVFTISGGKLVTGTLNGGGPEINITTMNGDVILRKMEAAK